MGRWAILQRVLGIAGGLAACWWSVCAAAPAVFAPPEKLSVVTDINYPPYLFQAEDGSLQGIIKDKWELWSGKTGVPAQVIGMDWAAAQRGVQAGSYDVLEALSYSEGRTRLYELSPPYAPVEARVYFHRSISGINDVATMRGFTIGVKTGSACGNWLAERGDQTLRAYSTSELLVQAAGAGEVRLFCMDATAAQYLLFKLGLADEFRQGPPLYSSRFHWAVGKGRVELRDFIQSGFERITAEERRSIEERWLGSPLRFPIAPRYWYYFASALAGILIAASLLILLNRSLRRRVAARTAELSVALGSLRAQAETLRESETRLKLSIEAAHIGLWDWNLVDDSVYFSPQYRSQLGHRDQDLGGHYRDWESRLHPEDKPRVVAKLRASLDGAAPAVEDEFRMLRRDGSYRWIYSRGEVLRDAAGKPYRVVGCSIDLTERKHVERALEAERTLFKSLVEHLPDQVFSLDRDGRYTMVNPAWLAAAGLRLESEVRGKTVFEVLPPENAARSDAQNRQIASTGVGVYDYGLRMRRPDGTQGWFLITKVPLFDRDGRYAGLIGARRDVTQLKETAEELARERNLLRSIIDHAPDAISVKDLELRYVLLNEAALRLLGAASMDEVVGKTIHDFVSWRAAQVIEQEDRQVLQSERPFLERQRKGAGNVQSEHWLSVSKVPLRDPGGKVSGVLALNRDITELHDAMEQARRLNIELEERVRLRTTELEEAVKELRAFSYSVSHDLRAPLRRASGFLNILSRSSMDKLAENERGMMRRIAASVQRMDQLIDDMLRLSRVADQEIRITDIDLSALALQIAADLRAADPVRDVAIRVADGMRAQADARLVRIVLENLMGNAWKFTGRSTAPSIEVGVTFSGEPTVFFVRDNGAGFDMQYAGRLFGAFQRLHHHDEFPGTGIGLATVARIVRRHGGRVWAESRPDEGATFHFTLASGRAGGWQEAASG
ncbi:MAG TPA: PAS domain S-box protein [Burkholderiales bacterium]|nr:PAS domain S-box protein [Burkholderiales bacterium]